MIPPLTRRIFAALDEGNPSSLADIADADLLRNAQVLDMLCKPFTYRAQYVETVVERPDQGFEARVRALFKPMNERSFALTFRPGGPGRLVLAMVQGFEKAGSWNLASRGVFEDNPAFVPDIEIASQTVRKFIYATAAGRVDVMRDLLSPGLAAAMEHDLEDLAGIGDGSSISEWDAFVRSDRGLKVQVAFRLRTKSSRGCGPHGYCLVEQIGGEPKIVGTRWGEGCTQEMGRSVEDPAIERYTLERFGLAAEAAPVRRGERSAESAQSGVSRTRVLQVSDIPAREAIDGTSPPTSVEEPAFEVPKPKDGQVCEPGLVGYLVSASGRREGTVEVRSDCWSGPVRAFSPERGWTPWVVYRSTVYFDIFRADGTTEALRKDSGAFKLGDGVYLKSRMSGRGSVTLRLP
jgi:hypothetical protein